MCGFSQNYRLQDIQLSKNADDDQLVLPAFAGARQLRRGGLRDRACQAAAPEGRRLVENTGLEPVTSWLQTRRSPS